MFTPIEASRLIVRSFQDADLAAFLAYRNDPEVARYQSWEAISAPRAQGFIQEQKTMTPGVPGQWYQFAVALKDTGQLIGDIGLQVQVHDARQAQVDISFNRAYQGQGLATEALTVVLDFAFINLDLHRVMAIMDVENERSAALMERVGLRREGQFIKNTWFKGHWADEYLYAVLQAEWLPRRGLPGTRELKAGAA